MNHYYFTYGSDGQPFCGGWTDVIAPDMESACGAFRVFHPDVTYGLLNCCAVYTEEQFKETCMYRSGRNLGAGCQEAIVIERTVMRSEQ